MTFLQMLKSKKTDIEGLQGSVGHSQTFINQGWIDALTWVIDEMEVDTDAVLNVPVQANNALNELLERFNLTPEELDIADDDLYLAIAAKRAGVSTNDVTSEMRSDMKRQLLSELYIR